jgi:hypothetical protein
VKALVEADSDRILGFTAFGVGAGEIIAAVQVAIIHNRRTALYRGARCRPNSPYIGGGSDTTVLIHGVRAQRRRDKRSPDLPRMR